ncbi:IS110 family transposase [Cupriavidus necator]|nr:IS110 family transposase [Cupriavidus necator]QQX85616.1 IS110 family transposase [Cupriavidus necator]
MNAMTYGLDIAKSVFQMYWVDPASGEIHNRRFQRRELIEFLSNCPAGKVALETCGGAHWWARKIQSLGHRPVLINAAYVRAFVRTNKTDAADARAIWTAAQQPGMPLVPVKTEEQQALLSLHRIREGLVQTRTRECNQLRGLLGEYGLHFAKGRIALLAELQTRRAEIEQSIPATLLRAIERQQMALRQLDEQIQLIERDITAWLKSEPAAQAVEGIPGIGAITATALVATMGSAQAFRSGRAFAASLGLVPAQSGTGGNVHLGHISKRGDSYLRRLLIHGARVVLTRSRHPPAWAEALLARRPKNVVIVALANKMARAAWALLAHGRQYDPNYVSQRPA